MILQFDRFKNIMNIKTLNPEEKSYDILWDGKQLIFKSGKLAPQADGSATASLGETCVLATVVVEKHPDENKDFLPLTVDFRESYYASGKIGGGAYQKREGKPSDQAILISRLIDRAFRPLFPKWMINDTVITITPLSIDRENPPAIPSIIWASLSLMLAWLPLPSPVWAVRIGYINGEYIINPSYEQLQKSALDLVVAWTKDTISMIEAWAKEVSEEILLKALQLAQQEIKKLVNWQEEFLKNFSPQNLEITVNYPSPDLLTAIKTIMDEAWLEQLIGKDKKNFWKMVDDMEQKVIEAFKDKIEDEQNQIFTLSKVKIGVFLTLKEFLRKKILEKEIRPDSRKLDEIRPLYMEIWLVPRTHGSGLFQRWETQVLSLTTLWAPGDVQLIDTMESDDEEKRFMHHYNFAPFSTGEARPTRAPSRREIWHWRLAEKALEPVIPSEEEFPYTIRVVSEVLSSNGSTSMASVCASSLSLMDAWVPIKKWVSGIAMGLIAKDGDPDLWYKILSDIQGTEDFIGDMDFKVAGTKDGITALQMDIKLKGVPLEVLKQAIRQANKWRNQILELMNQIISKPREEVSRFAPKIVDIKLLPTQVRDLIGPWGATITDIIKQTGVKIDIEDDGTVHITAKNEQELQKALKLIQEATWQPKEGDIIEWEITRIEPYGLFVNLGKGKVGLCHIKNLWWGFIQDINSHFKIGDKIKVQIIGIWDDWKIQLKRLI